MFGWFKRRHEDKLRFGNTERTQIMYLLPEDPREYLDPLSRQEVTRRVEWLSEKFGLVKELFHGTARHTVGTGLTLQLNSDDHEWNALAEADFLLYSLTKSRFDIANRRDFYAAQKTAVRQIGYRGEFFARATRHPRGPWEGEPCEQLFDTTEIRSPDNLGDEEKDIYDGVGLDEFLAPTKYFAPTSADPRRAFDAATMFHWYDPSGINQVRGQSSLSPVVNRLVDWFDLEKLVIKTAKTHSALAVAVRKLAKAGGRGAFNRINRTTPTGATASEKQDTSALEKAFGGAVAYLGADGDVQLVNAQTPNEKLAPFISSLIAPDVALAHGLPIEFFWSGDKSSGQDRRAILARADLRFKELADELIYGWCQGVAFRYLSHRMTTNGADGQPLLRPCTDPNWSLKMGWQQPARITVDNGRDGALELKQLDAGAENLRSIWDRRGGSYREQAIKQWLREWMEFIEEHAAMRKKLPKELQALWDMIPAKWRAGMPGAGQGTAPPTPGNEPPDAGGNSEEDTTTDEEDDDTNGKAA